MLRKNVLLLLLVSSLLLVLSAAPQIAHAAQKPVVVIHFKGALEPDVQLEAIMSNITDIEWVVVTEELKAADLANAAMLIMVKADASLEYTDDELSAIKTWFDKGGKTLWVAGDSDYGDDRLRQPTANKVLEAVGSVLRVEACAAEDPVSSAGKPYRVLGLSEKCDERISFLVKGVTRGLFHGPASIIAYVNGKYIKLEEEKPDNVYRIMWTSVDARIVNHNPPDPEAHEVGDEGTFVLMAMEIDYEKKNIVIATGDAPFDHYMGLYMPELRKYDRYAVEYPQQGATLFRNIVTWAIYHASTMIELWNQVADLQGKVKTLEDKAKTLEGEKKDLESKVKSLEGQVATLESEKKSLEGKVKGLEGQVATLEGETKKLKDDVASLQASIGTWQGIAAATFVVGLIIGAGVVFALRKRA